MKEKYDFSKGTRGRFYNPDAVFKEPIHLDEEIQNYLTACANSQGIELSELVNRLLRKDIERIEAGQ